LGSAAYWGVAAVDQQVLSGDQLYGIPAEQQHRPGHIAATSASVSSVICALISILIAPMLTALMRIPLRPYSIAAAHYQRELAIKSPRPLSNLFSCL
jgi:hypothetical protein